jgi:hypothetical protein
VFHWDLEETGGKIRGHATGYSQSIRYLVKELNIESILKIYFFVKIPWSMEKEKICPPCHQPIFKDL